MPLQILCLIMVLALPAAGQPETHSLNPTASVVKVSARSECATNSQGSGVVIAPGIVATSAHVVQGTRK